MKTDINKIWSINEWGKLKELILGDPTAGRIPSMDDISQLSFDRLNKEQISKIKPDDLPDFVIEETIEDINDLESTLKSLSIKVHQSSSIDLSESIQTPLWSVEQETSINIRDLTFILGDLCIDTPSPTRGRYCESFSVRKLLNDYYKDKSYRGYLSTPKPCMWDENYDLELDRGMKNIEPLFDAANCMRFGKDIIIDINNTANQAGAIWLQSTLDLYYPSQNIKLHPVKYSPDHIDVIIMPLYEGCAMINPDYVTKDMLPDFMQNWDIIIAPEMVE